MNRRQLLLRGALLAALTPVVRAAGTIDPKSGGNAPPRLLAVHDPAYRRSREFALGLQERGAHMLALEPDVLAAWHGTLSAAIATTTQLRIVGLTTYTDYLVLRDLARTAGLVSLATHDVDAGAAHRRATLIAWVLAPRNPVD